MSTIPSELETSPPIAEGDTPLLPLLLVDDDAPFRQRLTVLLQRRGFAVTAAGSLAEARVEAARLKPSHAVVDMRLDDGNGLTLVTELRAVNPDMRIVVLTGYGNLATAVAAVKAGAVDYLAKPADPEDIVRALNADEGERPEAPPEPMSADRVRWEHIQRVYELCDRNVSETARRLKMHRRTLQRILAKRSPR
ncbi:MAG: ActR/PrrA/RegA family redox response regulator transcription factor [Polymorphobacter sp.]|uniref:ActR/PrrA/RegA family redox response regulator transcription factor n=1 Tax=Polymorphobacter sp. TaxID=1909290 RepID=UPI003A899E6F